MDLQPIRMFSSVYPHPRTRKFLITSMTTPAVMNLLRYLKEASFTADEIKGLIQAAVDIKAKRLTPAQGWV